MTKNLHAHSISAAFALLTVAGLVALGASPARADHRCDDIANQLKNHIDGLKVGITAANTIYLSHPQASELSLGCSGRNFKNELYAKAHGRIATALMRHLLAIARGAGLKELTAEVLSENAAMLKVFSGFGFRARSGGDPQVRHLVLQLS